MGVNGFLVHVKKENRYMIFKGEEKHINKLSKGIGFNSLKVGRRANSGQPFMIFITAHQNLCKFSY